MADLKNKIATILNIPNNNSWQIVDAHPEQGLYLIHYTSDASMIRYGSIRGIVVDVPHQVIVARSYGFTPLALSSSLTIAEYDNKIHLNDAINPNVTYQLDPETTKFYPGFEGALIRVFLHNGHVYHSTHRKLEFETLKWGSSPSYLEIYQELGGPSDDQLFDLSKKYSPYVHIFMLAHLDLQVASKTQTPALVYLGSRQMWDPKAAPYPQNEIDSLDRGVAATDKFDSSSDEPIVYAPSPMSLDEVNHHLNFGFYETFDVSHLEERLWLGEFIVAFLYKNDELTGVIKIESPSYHWRMSIRDNNPNLLHQFFLLSDGKFIQADNDPEREVYLRKFPLLTPYNEDELQELIPFGPNTQSEMTQETREEILSNPSSRLYNIFLDLLYSTPFHQQIDVVDAYSRYETKLEWIEKRLYEYYLTGQAMDEDLPPRARRLIELSRDKARQEINLGNENTFDELVKQELHRLINLEEGSSLYRLAI